MFAVMLLPIQLIRGLQMPTKRKLSIAALFGLGWVCISISTLRAAYLGNESTKDRFRQPSTSWLALWAIVEASIGTIMQARTCDQALTQSHSGHHRLLSGLVPRSEDYLQQEQQLLPRTRLQRRL